MKKTGKFIAFLLVLSGTLSLAFCQSLSTQKFKAGDIIFISSSSGQGRAIQLATKSKYTHVGIFLPNEKGELMVYHAVEPVKRNTLKEFLEYSADGQYEVFRLKDSTQINPENVPLLLSEAKKMMGKHYDIYFGWSDSEIYCTEFVWKIYKRALNLEPGPLKPLGSFDLSSPIVKKIMADRYGKEIPLKENMISPGDMHDWAGLKRVY